MTLQDSVKKEWEATSSNDKLTLQKAGFLAAQEILTQAATMIQKKQSIDSIRINSTYAGAGAVLVDLLWRIAVRYYNENRVSSKLHVSPVSFKSREGGAYMPAPVHVTIDEVQALNNYLREMF